MKLHLKTEPKKIALHGLPRSGTTWLGCIMDSNPFIKYAYQPLFSYAFKGFLDEESRADRIQEFFDNLSTTSDSFVNQVDAKSNALVPIFQKSSPVQAIVYKEVRYHNILSNLFATDPSIYGIFIIRSPIDVMNSWINAPKEFESHWIIENEWQFAPSKNLGRREEFYGFEKWKQATKLFLDLAERFPKRIICVNYEDLKSEPAKTTSQIFTKVGLQFHQQTSEFLLNSQTNSNPSPYSVFRGKPRKLLRKVLPQMIVDEINLMVSQDLQLNKYFNEKH